MEGHDRAAATDAPQETPAGMAWLPGGRFLMGSDRHYPEEGPVHAVTVSGFWIDTHAVTNRAFRDFVRATGYRTVAERPLDPARYPGADPALLVPGAMVFQSPAGPFDKRDLRHWWRYVQGACWHAPEGPGSTIEDRLDHPVVQVAYADAKAYARFARKDLPREAEWEYAARGGIEGAAWCWGEEMTPAGRFMANSWQGAFPYENTCEDGWSGTAPVGSFPANGFGLFDMAGNVWEWTSDWYAAGHEGGASCCGGAIDPRGAAKERSYDAAMPAVKIPRKVIKGGSYLCAPGHCVRFRPAARQPQMIDSATTHIGFRCVRRPG